MENVPQRCFKNIFSSDLPPCNEPARYKGTGTGNHTDNWTWCSLHAPAPKWRQPINGKDEPHG